MNLENIINKTKKNFRKLAYAGVVGLIFIFVCMIPSVNAISNVHIDPLVITQLSHNKWVRVIVLLKDTSPINYDSRLSKEENYKIYLEKAKYFDIAENNVLKKLPHDRFKLDTKYHIINAFTGSITKRGLGILVNLPDVLSIEGEHAGQGHGGGGN